MRVSFGDFVLDRATRQVLRGGKERHLEPKAFDLLDLLLVRRPEAVAKTEIQERLWPDTFVSESSLTSLVAQVRQALGDNSRRPRFVRTVYGFGYAFCGTATSPSGKGSPDSPTPARFRLFFDDREIALTEAENILGRGDESVVTLHSSTVSRRHARILINLGQATLEDLGSKNGTYLRGERVRTPAHLEDRDEIRIGCFSLTFRIFSKATSTKTETRR